MSPDGVTATVGCGFVLLWLAFWIAVIVVAVHFISKWW